MGATSSDPNDNYNKQLLYDSNIGGVYSNETNTRIKFLPNSEFVGNVRINITMIDGKIAIKNISVM